jgi:hypothetical protein
VKQLYRHRPSAATFRSDCTGKAGTFHFYQTSDEGQIFSLQTDSIELTWNKSFIDACSVAACGLNARISIDSRQSATKELPLGPVDVVNSIERDEMVRQASSEGRRQSA